MSRPKATLLIGNAAELLTFKPVRDEKGRESWKPEIIQNGWIAVSGTKIVAVGTEQEVKGSVDWHRDTPALDATGRLVTPGLVDAHTHPVFARTRENEFEMRCQGKTYEEIARAGGGIRSSVRAVREASKEELKQAVRPRLDRFLEYGVTTIEAKSGYGLSPADEIKSLEVIDELNREHPLDLVPTFLGAHEIPDEYRDRREIYIQLLTGEMIPEVARRQLAEYCDVFCEQGVYSVEESREILQVARKEGMGIRVHADQLHATGATEMAVEMGAASADHLDQISEKGIKILADSQTFAGLLPGAVFFLGMQRYAPARRLIDAGARVFLSTDFNPGSSMTQNLALMMTIGCVYMKMTPAEAWQACTIHPAASLGRQNRIGTLLPGYQADVVIWEADNYRMVPYFFGVNLTHCVIKKGKIVFSRNGARDWIGRNPGTLFR